MAIMAAGYLQGAAKLRMNKAGSICRVDPFCPSYHLFSNGLNHYNGGGNGEKNRFCKGLRG